MRLYHGIEDLGFSFKDPRTLTTEHTVPGGGDLSPGGEGATSLRNGFEAIAAEEQSTVNDGNGGDILDFTLHPKKVGIAKPLTPFTVGG